MAPRETENNAYAKLGTTILENGKAHFGPTDRNDQTCHCGPPSKLVPNSLNIRMTRLEVGCSRMS